MQGREHPQRGCASWIPIPSALITVASPARPTGSLSALQLPGPFGVRLALVSQHKDQLSEAPLKCVLVRFKAVDKRYSVMGATITWVSQNVKRGCSTAAVLPRRWRCRRRKAVRMVKGGDSALRCSNFAIRACAVF